jgi:hypothetical protein
MNLKDELTLEMIMKTMQQYDIPVNHTSVLSFIWEVKEHLQEYRSIYKPSLQYIVTAIAKVRSPRSTPARLDQ